MSGGGRPPEQTDERGLTLVELLIAFMILSVAMVAVLGMFPVASRHLRAGGDMTRATGLAQQMVEQLRSQPFQFLPSYHRADTRETVSFPSDDQSGTPAFRGGASFRQWRDEISAASLGGDTDRRWGRIEVSPLDRRLLSITVIVGWSADSTERSVQLVTNIAQQ